MQPTPVVVTPAPVSAGCDPSASALFIEAVRNSPQQKDPVRQISIHTSGAWVVRSEGGPDQTGCLGPSDLAAFSQALAAADFAPPPAPRIQCKAMPTRFTTYTDVQGQRHAVSSNPCGRQPNGDVLRVSTMARTLVAPAQPAPKPAPPQACRRAGKPLYDFRTEPIMRDQQAMLSPPTELVTIYTSGYWIRDQSGTRTSGCLIRAQIRTIDRAIAAARLRRSSNTVRCAAVPNAQVTLTVPKGVYRWSTPCGADGPDESVGDLIEVIESMLANGN